MNANKKKRTKLLFGSLMREDQPGHPWKPAKKVHSSGQKTGLKGLTREQQREKVFEDTQEFLRTGKKITQIEFGVGSLQSGFFDKD